MSNLNDIKNRAKSPHRAVSIDEETHQRLREISFDQDCTMKWAVRVAVRSLYEHLDIRSQR